ncbi:DUF3078 domain-containing protein [Carboxylicivirga sp. A043]|uniref:DUF3078 domain-containing protein n=1 Tax=Carboxylicivirga litoralis TaxID=2816963 RepID=UPI0021CB93AC|nr:DUF3078 domain-containing protein [Carboxylicivirga sp. A043]MCU4156020.1 DUF3078 domain-containing protein [Carboxylicivirga sp. A043]
MSISSVTNKRLVIILLVFCFGLSTLIKAQWQGVGFDWRYWSEEPSLHRPWQRRLFKYQDVDRYPQFNQLYIAEYIGQQVEEQKEFESYLFPPLKKYSIETYKFEPKFRMPILPDIWYQPQFYTKKELREYEELMRSTALSNKHKEKFSERFFISEARDNYVFTHPENIMHSWDSIPEPPRLGRGGFLKRRSARDGINLLLRDNAYDTHPSLEKIKFSSGPWTLKGTENILLSQGYVENWVKGGESSISLGSDLRLIANYKKGKHEWDNYIIHKIGVVSTENDPGRVNTDLIELNTKYGHKASEKWYYSFLYNFKTQFFYGYNKDDVDKETPISGFLAPAYMSFAIGMDFKPSSKYTLLLSPITTRVTLVNDIDKFDETDYGIAEGEKTNVVNGISIVNNLAYQVSKEVKLSSMLDAFYQYLGKVREGEERQVQIDWEVIADMRINRFLTTRILAHLRYFTNESNRVQIRESFNITFSYNF